MNTGSVPCIARPEWGLPEPFGSSSHVNAMVRQLAEARKAAHDHPVRPHDAADVAGEEAAVSPGAGTSCKKRARKTAIEPEL
jgi:hypothetical protein